jgi:hypothetical protein
MSGLLRRVASLLIPVASIEYTAFFFRGQGVLEE